MSDDITLLTGGREFTGWQGLSLSRSTEAVPNSFTILATDPFPRDAALLFVKPGDTCQVLLGGDVVITGYVDRVAPTIGPAEHSLRIMGRGKCQDLVDCSAVINSMQISAASAAKLIADLAAPFGISVSAPNGPGPMIPQFNVNLGETPWDIIEQVARYSALLPYEDANGNLVLAQAGSAEMASGFVEGYNIEGARTSFSMDQRFSRYTAVLQNTESLSDIGSGGNLQGICEDKGVPRFRPRIIVSEQNQNGQYIAMQRAQWEMARRYGRSQMVSITCDSWRDGAGMLWQPNWLAPVDVPSCKLANVSWVIVNVNYTRDEDGSRATLALMPRAALLPEPTVLQLYDWQVGQELAAGQSGLQI
jgi:prophage tail gpP-like protein